MYFGLSFSRVGADFRGLMAKISQNFSNSILKVTRQFEGNIENYTLINKFSSGLNRSKSGLLQSDGLSPPESLLDFQPLAIYCNGILTFFNEVRLCAPVAIADTATICIQTSLETVSRSILSFYRQEQQAFTGSERDNFIKLCTCFAYDLIPYIQKCIHVIFPTNVLATHLGISALTLQKEGLTFLKQKQILEPIQHLLPDRVETVLMQASVELKITDEKVEVVTEELKEFVPTEPNLAGEGKL